MIELVLSFLSAMAVITQHRARVNRLLPRLLPVNRLLLSGHIVGQPVPYLQGRVNRLASPRGTVPMVNRPFQLAHWPGQPAPLLYESVQLQDEKELDCANERAIPAAALPRSKSDILLTRLLNCIYLSQPQRSTRLMSGRYAADGTNREHALVILVLHTFVCKPHRT